MMIARMDWFPLTHTNTGIVGVLSLLLISYYLLKWSRGVAAVASKGKTAPEPRGRWPLIGHLPLLAGSQLPHIALGSLADRYGPIFTLRLGGHSVLVVSNWEVAKETFTTNDMAASSRPLLVAAKYLTYNYAMFPFSPHGPYWRETRKMATAELLSNSRLELLKHVRIEEVQSSLMELYNTWMVNKNDVGRVLVDVKRWLGDINLNVILRMVVGKKHFGDGNDQARRCQQLSREFFHYVFMPLPSDVFPFLGWLDLGGHEKAMKRTLNEFDSIIEQCLEERKRERASGDDIGERNFMDVLLSELHGKSFAGYDSYDADTVIKAMIMSMITGGSDTVSVAMTYAFSLLLNNPNELKKAQEELDTLVGKERLVNEADISKLVYLQAIVKEALRLYPPATIPFPRQFTEDCTVAGYHVPKGTLLVLNLPKIHTDPGVWANPLEFKPERFLTTHKGVDVRGKNYELVPFGSGRRSCPAKDFGLKMVHLALAGLIHAFEFSTPTNAPVDMTRSHGLTNSRAAPLDVLISPRLPPHCFE